MKDRIVTSSRGVDAAMGYKFRARVDSRTRKLWFGFGRKVTEYRYVIERYFMSWHGRLQWGVGLR